MKFIYGIIAVLIGTIWFTYMNDLHAGEWNDKPVICEQIYRRHLHLGR